MDLLTIHLLSKSFIIFTKFAGNRPDLSPIFPLNQSGPSLNKRVILSPSLKVRSSGFAEV